MAVIRPFKALRAHSSFAHLVASVPYDVVNTEEARILAQDNPLSLLHITRSEIDLPAGTNPYSPEVYEKAKENLETLKKEHLTVEDTPRFYLYRLVMDGRAQTGIVATFSVEDYKNDVIMKHEKTRKEKEDDRTNHILTTHAQTGPVFLTYRGHKEIEIITDQIISSEQPLYNFTAPDGIKHTVWILPKQFNETVTSGIGGVDKLYIADGHHRAASAARTADRMKSENVAHTGSEEYNFFIAVLFPASQLAILPYNRIVTDLNGKTTDEFLGEVNEKFMVEQLSVKAPPEAKQYSMYVDGHWYVLYPRDNIKASNTLTTSVADTLDVSVLQNFLLNPILGIDDPRTNKRVDFVGGIRGTGELERLVDSGKAAVAFSLYPVTVDDLMRISDAGEIMPPKSTWFEPKLRDGLLIHTV